MSAYLESLVNDLARRSEQSVRIRLRTLLREFGYGRRHSTAVALIRGALHERGLSADLSVRHPARLDDRVTVRLLPAARARGGGWPRRAAPAAAASALPGVRVPPPAGPEPTDVSTIAEAAVQATVRIACGDGVGAGAIVHPDGLVLTARHVVHDGASTRRVVDVRLADGKRLRGWVVRSHWPLDLALLWLDRPGPFASLPLGDATALRVAEPLIAVGHPSDLKNTVTRGVVGNPRAHFFGVECVQTDTAMDEGNSGGPVLNLRGEVVAVSTWKSGDLDSGKFAVPVDYLLDDIATVLSLGRAACLRARYCLTCGHLEVTRRLAWCPTCGATHVVHGRRRA